MKVAVCIFGQLRGDEETFQSIYENLVKSNDADVYIHTWSYLEDKVYSPYVREDVKSLIDYDVKPHMAWVDTASKDYSEPNKFVPDDERIRLSYDKLHAINSILKPKKFQQQEQVIFDATDYVLSNPHILHTDGLKNPSDMCTLQMIDAYQRTKSQALTRKLAFELIEDPYDYDIIYISRNDVLMNQKLILSDVIDINNKGIYSKGDANWFQDRYFCGDPASIAKSCEMYEKFDEIVINHNGGRDAQFNEYHLATHIRNSGINFIPFDLTNYYNSEYFGIKYTNYINNFI